VIVFGSAIQTLTVLLGRATGSWIEPVAPTRRFDALGVVGELAEKAMALWRYDEGERLIEGPFQQMVNDVASHVELSSAVITKATDWPCASRRHVEGTGLIV